MQVAVIQSGECGLDRAATLEDLGRRVESAVGTAGCDLVVLPELCTAPYFAGAPFDESYRSWAEPIPGPSTAFFSRLCRELDTAIAFGMAEQTPQGRLHNSLVFLDRTGEVVPGRLADGGTAPAFRKLTAPKVTMPGFTLDESAYFTPGPGPMTFDLDGVRCGALICYDRAFSEVWLANRHLGADVVIAAVSSFGWRSELFVPDLRLRAAEMGVFVVAANRGGTEQVGGHRTTYFGRSCVISPAGHVLAEAPPDVAGVTLRADLALDSIPAARESWPVWRDRRPELYGFLYDDQGTKVT